MSEVRGKMCLFITLFNGLMNLSKEMWQIIPEGINP